MVMQLNLLNEINKSKFGVDEVDVDFIRDFYESADLFLLPGSSRRQYKLILPDGSVLVPKKRIKSPSDLRKLCIKHTPVAVYQSVSKWLNPSILTNRGSPRRGGWKSLSNWFLGSDFLMDMDAEHVDAGNLKKALDFVRGYDEWLVVRTGHGYHFWIFNPFKTSKVFSSPFNHERHILNKMEDLVYFLKDVMGIDFDFSVSRDTRRVARVVGSLHYSTKSVIQPLVCSHQFALSSKWGEAFDVSSFGSRPMSESPAWDRKEEEWLVPSFPEMSLPASHLSKLPNLGDDLND